MKNKAIEIGDVFRVNVSRYDVKNNPTFKGNPMCMEGYGIVYALDDKKALVSDLFGDSFSMKWSCYFGEDNILIQKVGNISDIKISKLKTILEIN